MEKSSVYLLVFMFLMPGKAPLKGAFPWKPILKASCTMGAACLGPLVIKYCISPEPKNWVLKKIHQQTAGRIITLNSSLNLEHQPPKNPNNLDVTNFLKQRSEELKPCLKKFHHKNIALGVLGGITGIALASTAIGMLVSQTLCLLHTDNHLPKLFILATKNVLKKFEPISLEQIKNFYTTNPFGKTIRFNTQTIAAIEEEINKKNQVCGPQKQ